MATNLYQDPGNVLSVVVTNPAAPDSGDPVRFGSLTGLALVDEGDGGYDGGISIEPHMAVVFHDKSVQSDAEARYRNYIDYGRRLEKMHPITHSTLPQNLISQIQLHQQSPT